MADRSALAIQLAYRFAGAGTGMAAPPASGGDTANKSLGWEAVAALVREMVAEAYEMGRQGGPPP